jgi:hypothetical protein
MERAGALTVIELTALLVRAELRPPILTFPRN